MRTNLASFLVEPQSAIFLAWDDDRPAASLFALTNDLRTSRYGDRSYPLDYYTRERLTSREARTGWVAPELRAWEA